MELECEKCGKRLDSTDDATKHSKETGHHTFKFRTVGRIVSIG